MPRADIICLQETHLTESQEYAFVLYAPGYDWFCSHGTTNSGGVACAFKRHSGVKAHKVGEIPGHLIAIDVLDGSLTDFRLLHLYAPAYPQLRCKFFCDYTPFAIDNMVVVGDKNSVIEKIDRLSGNLDGTLLQLRRWLANYNLEEVDNSHKSCFTFHHLSKPEQKGQIDQIYTNLNLTNLKGFSQPCTVSDHYLVGVYSLPPIDLGPK